MEGAGLQSPKTTTDPRSCSIKRLNSDGFRTVENGSGNAPL